MSNILAVAGSNSKYQQSWAEPAGFWAGLWHGLIMPVTFIVSIFDPGVRIYEARNNGRWYEFGFILGASAALGGGTSQVESTVTRRSAVLLMSWL